MKIQIPKLLIYARLLLGLAIILVSIFRFNHFQTVSIVLLSLGLLTDIFDGIIARKLGISTVKLRRLDSTIDVIFFLSAGIAIYIQCPAFFSTNATKLIILLATEALTYLVCLIKFRKEIATHSLGAKAWTLILFATIIDITLNCQSSFLFEICFWAGILTRLEIIAIILILKNWMNDVPSFIHAIKLRQHKEIRRNKLFNG